MLKSSSFYTELHSLPLFKSAEGLYGQIKDTSRIASAGLTVLEYSCTVVMEKLYDGSTVAHNVDEMAGKGVAKLVNRYPTLSKSPNEIQEKTTSVVKDTVRSVMRTAPGRVVLKGLDWAVDRTEGLLLKVKPYRPRSPSKKNRTRSQALGKDHAYALDDSGACDSDTRLPSTKSPSIPAAVQKLTESDSQTLKQRLIRLACITPLETTVHLLKTVRRYAGGKRRKVYTSDLSPKHKDGRRKVSPKKKMGSSILGKLTHRALGLFGYPGIGKRISLDALKVGSSSPGNEEGEDEKHEKKRKHEEILTDQDSDSSEDMANFDFDGYESEDDPDYQPSEESESDLSINMSEGETESDLETEPAVDDKFHLQIKDGKKPEIKDNNNKDKKDNKNKDEKKDKKDEGKSNNQQKADQKQSPKVKDQTKKPEANINGKDSGDKKPEVKTDNISLRPSSPNFVVITQNSQGTKI